MINKKSLWFLTLFSLILVLCIYYITMPSELLLKTSSTKTNEQKDSSTPTVATYESDILVALRVEADEKMEKEIESLQTIIADSKSSTDDKNNAYNKIKEINDNRGIEESLEKTIKDTYKLNSFIKISGNQISVTVESENHDKKLANDIMRTIQSNFQDSKYITVKFQK